MSAIPSSAPQTKAARPARHRALQAGATVGSQGARATRQGSVGTCASRKRRLETSLSIAIPEPSGPEPV